MVKMGDNNVMVDDQYEDGLQSDFPAANLTKIKERKREKYSKACPIRIESSPCHRNHVSKSTNTSKMRKEKPSRGHRSTILLDSWRYTSVLGAGICSGLRG